MPILFSRFSYRRVSKPRDMATGLVNFCTPVHFHCFHADSPTNWIQGYPWKNCCLVFCPKACSFCLVYSRRKSYLLNTKIARAHLYGGARFLPNRKLIYSGDRTWNLSHRSSSLNPWATTALYERIQIIYYDFIIRLYKYYVNIILIYCRNIIIYLSILYDIIGFNWNYN